MIIFFHLDDLVVDETLYDGSFKDGRMVQVEILPAATSVAKE